MDENTTTATPVVADESTEETTVPAEPATEAPVEPTV